MQSFLFLEHLSWVHMVGCESLSPSQLRLYGLHKFQAVPLSLEVARTRRKLFLARTSHKKFTRNSSLTNSNKCHMCSSSVYSIKLLRPLLSLWRCTSLCTMFMRPLSMNYYQFPCPYIPYRICSKSCFEPLLQ